MSDQKKTIEVILAGRNQLGPAFAAGGNVVSSFTRGTIGAVKQAVDSVFSLQNAIEGAAVVLAAKAVFKPAIEMESFKSQFGVLMGSLDKAEARLRDLTEFADTTPFELPGVVNASKILQVLTGDVYAAGAGLRFVGDVAAGTGTPIEEMAMWIGRLYDGIKSGREIGMAAMYLQRLGAMSGEARNKIEELTAAGASSREVWAVATEAMGRFNGMTEKMAQTAGGRLSTLSDSWRAVRREVGEAALPALKSAIEDVLAEIEKLKASGELKKWGETLGGAITDLMKILKGTAKFIDEHGTAIKVMLGSYIGWKVIDEAILAITAMRAAIAANTAAVVAETAAQTSLTAVQSSSIVIQNDLTKALAARAVAQRTTATTAMEMKAAFGSVGALLQSLAMLGAAGFAGWGIGTALRDLTGLGEALDRFVEKYYFIQGKLSIGGQAEENFHPLNMNKEFNPENERIRINAYFRWIEEGKSPADFQADWDRQRREQKEEDRKATESASPADDGLSSEKSDAFKKKVADAQAKVDDARKKLQAFDADKFRDQALDAAEARVKALKSEEDKLKTAVDNFETKADLQAKQLQAAREKFFATADEKKEDAVDEKKAARADRRLQKQIQDARERAAKGYRAKAGDADLLRIPGTTSEFRFDSDTERKIAAARGQEAHGGNLSRRNKELIALDHERDQAVATSRRADREKGKLPRAEAAVATAEKIVQSMKSETALVDAAIRRADIARSLLDAQIELSRLTPSATPPPGAPSPSSSPYGPNYPSIGAMIADFKAAGFTIGQITGFGSAGLPPPPPMPAIVNAGPGPAGAGNLAGKLDALLPALQQIATNTRNTFQVVEQ